MPDAGGVTAAPAPSSPTTTTMTLGDAGDLQGAKLQSSSHDGIDGGHARRGAGSRSAPVRARALVKDIQVIVQAHRDEARACYDQVAAGSPDPTMKGNLDVKWTIDPTGKVTDIVGR